MKARGVETSNSLLNKTGITRTKPKTNTTETSPTLRVSKTGENGKTETKDIPINKEQESVLKRTDPTKINEKAKELDINIPEGYKIEVNRNKINRFKTFIHRGNSEIFGEPITQTKSSNLKTNEEFENYLNNRNWWNKFTGGSNKDIRRYDKYLGNNNVKSLSEETSSKQTNN